MHGIVTFVAEFVIVVPVIVWMVVVSRLAKNKRLRFVIFTVVSGLLAILLAKVAASLHSDPRPFIRDGVQPYFASSKDNGFPSDHTLLASLLAFVVLTYNRKLGAALLVTAALIGWARVVGNVHHAQDIVGAFVITAISTAVAYLLMTLVTRSRSPKPNQSTED